MRPRSRGLASISVATYNEKSLLKRWIVSKIKMGVETLVQDYADLCETRFSLPTDIDSRMPYVDHIQSNHISHSQSRHRANFLQRDMWSKSGCFYWKMRIWFVTRKWGLTLWPGQAIVYHFWDRPVVGKRAKSQHYITKHIFHDHLQYILQSESNWA